MAKSNHRGQPKLRNNCDKIRTLYYKTMMEEKKQATIRTLVTLNCFSSKISD